MFSSRLFSSSNERICWSMHCEATFCADHDETMSKQNKNMNAQNASFLHVFSHLDARSVSLGSRQSEMRERTKKAHDAVFLLHFNQIELKSIHSLRIRINKLISRLIKSSPGVIKISNAALSVRREPSANRRKIEPKQKKTVAAHCWNSCRSGRIINHLESNSKIVLTKWSRMSTKFTAAQLVVAAIQFFSAHARALLQLLGVQMECAIVKQYRKVKTETSAKR